MNVQPEDIGLAAVIFGTMSVTIISLARMKFNAATRREKLPDAAVEDRLERIEQAVDAIAVEVERMSESQRYTTKLLAERLPTPNALPGVERGRT
jgi:regulator of sirC expression with transglutaminase-like and TPR domain